MAWGRERGFQVAMDEGQAVCTVVNATPIGLGVRDGLPVPRERIADAEVALDLVYRPGGTPWVNELTDSGKRAIDGRAVLVAQGAQAFERFFPGVEAPRGLMRAAIDRALRG